MTRLFRNVLLIVLSAAAIPGLAWPSYGCGSPASSARGSDFSGGPAICEDGPRKPSGTVRPRLTSVGPSSNAIAHGDGRLWIVESGANTVSTYDYHSSRYRSGVIDVGSGHNPYEIALKGERVYVTNWLDDSVTVADRSDGEIVREIGVPELDRPQGIAATDQRLFVANVELEGRNQFGPGSIVALDRDSGDVVGHVETAWKNPQFVRRVETPQGPRLAVSSAGSIAIVDGRAQLQSPGGLELWPLESDLRPEDRSTYELGYQPETDVGAPGRPLPTPDGRSLYFTSATAPVLFEFDLHERRWVHDASNPIRLYQTDENALHRGRMGNNGVLYVTAFNRDALYLYDTSCDRRLAGPIELGRAPDRLEGPQQLVTVPRDGAVDAYYLTLSNALGRVRLRY